MPVLKGSVSFSRFRAEPKGKLPSKLGDWLTEVLRLRAFAPIDRRSQERSCGFVELEDHDAVEFSPGSLFHGDWALMSWRVDQIKVPASAVRAELEKWAQSFEREASRKPKRAEKNARRDAIQQMLRAKAEPRTRIVDVSWNLARGQVQLWVASRKAVEELRDVIEKNFQVTLVPQVLSSVAEAMGISESGLKPTPGLASPELSEAAHG